MPAPRLSRRQLIGAAAAGAASAAAGSLTRAQGMDHGQPVRPASALPPGKIPVAVMLDDNATMMDFAGPWEVFQDVAMGGGSGYYLYTVAPQMRQYNTTGAIIGHGMKGLNFTPDFIFADAPQPKVVVMGAQMNWAGKEKIAWLQKSRRRPKSSCRCAPATSSLRMPACSTD